MRLFGVSLLSLAFFAPFFASAAVPPPSCSMTAVPSVIQLGGSVTLKWQSQNASSTTITGVGKVATQGQVNLIPPPQGTTFRGTFVGAGGTTTCQAIVRVESSSAGTGGISTGGISQGEGGGPLTIEQQKFSQGKTVSPNPPQSSGEQGGLVQCRGLTCTWCELGKLIQRLINFLIGLSIPLATLLFAWAGVLYFTSGANPGNKDRAKKIFSDVFIGFLIAIGAYVVINTILVALLDKSDFPAGSWFSIRCDTAARPGADYAVSINDVLKQVLPQLQVSQEPVTRSSSYGCEAGLDYAPDSNQCISADGKIVKDATSLSNPIADGALKAFQEQMSTVAGPYDPSRGGNIACVWAVNSILREQNIAPLDGNSVEGLQLALTQGGRGEYITTQSAQPGDLIVWKEGNVSHVGVCQSLGCASSVSNSSRNQSFSNQHTSTSFQGVEGKIYRVR